MVKTTKEKYEKKALEFFKKPNVIEAINEENWVELEKLLYNEHFNWIIYGIIWSSIYNIKPDFLNTLNHVPSGCFAYTDIRKIELPDNIKSINTASFYNSTLSEITIPTSVEKISSYVFIGSDNNLSIYYKGEYKSWRKIKKDNNYLKSQFHSGRAKEEGNRIVYCSDKEISLG